MPKVRHAVKQARRFADNEVGDEWVRYWKAKLTFVIIVGFAGCPGAVPYSPDAAVRRTYLEFAHSKQAPARKKYEQVKFDYFWTQKPNPTNPASRGKRESSTRWSEVIDGELVVVHYPPRESRLTRWVANETYSFTVDQVSGSKWHFTQLMESGPVFRTIHEIFGADTVSNKSMLSLVNDTDYMFETFQRLETQGQPCWVLNVKHKEAGHSIELGFSDQSGCALWRKMSFPDGENTLTVFEYAEEGESCPIIVSITLTTSRAIVKHEFRNVRFDARIDPKECRLSHYGLPEPDFKSRESNRTRYMVIGGIGIAFSLALLWYLRKR